MKRRQEDRSNLFYSMEDQPKYQHVGNQLLDMLFMDDTPQNCSPSPIRDQAFLDEMNCSGVNNHHQEKVVADIFEEMNRMSYSKGNENHHSIAMNFKKEQNISLFAKRFIQLIELGDEKKFKEGCVSLVLGYFNKFLNGMAETFEDNVQEFDNVQNMVWYASTIGNGGFGTVLKVIKRNPKTKQIESIRAIKVIPNSTMGLSEAIHAAKLNHPNVIKVYNVILIRFICCIEMEYLESGNLSDVMALKLHIPSESIERMLFQSCEVLALMKQIGMVHSDIKPENIMLRNRNDFQVAIGDFGLTLQSETMVEQTKGGTLLYTAPELIANSFYPTFHSDIYSLGVTFQKLIAICGKNMPNMEYLKQILLLFTSKNIEDRELAFYQLVFKHIYITKAINSVWENDALLLSLMLSYCGTIEKTMAYFGLTVKIGERACADRDFIVKHNLFQLADKSLCNDREFILQAVKQNVSILKSVTDQKLRNDREIILEAVKRDYRALTYIDDSSIYSDREIVMHAIRQNGAIIAKLDPSFKLDRELVMTAIRSDYSLLKYADDSLKKDKEFIIQAFRKCRYKVIEFADKSLKRDRQFMLEAVKIEKHSIDYAHESLMNDREIALEVMKNSYYKSALDRFDKSLLNDREIFLELARKDPKVLKNHRFLQDRSIVMEALKHNLWVFEYLDESYGNDREMILQLVKTNYLALVFASETLRRDREIILEAVKQNYRSLMFIDDLLKRDEGMCMEVDEQVDDYSPLERLIIQQRVSLQLEWMKQNGENSTENDPSEKTREILEKAERACNRWNFEKSSETLRSDRQIVLEVVKQKGPLLNYVAKSLQNDREIVIEAVKQHYNSLMFASESLKHDREILLIAFKQGYSYHVAGHIDQQLLMNDRELVLEILMQNSNYFKELDQQFKQDREMAMMVVKKNRDAFEFVDESLKQDKTFVMEIVKHDHRVIKLVPAILRKDREIILETVKRHYSAFEFADESLKNDKEIILEMLKHVECSRGRVKERNLFRKFIVEAMKKYQIWKKDREIVLETVKKEGWALKYVDDYLKKDKEIALEAIKQHYKAFEFIDETLKKDRDVLSELLKQDGWPQNIATQFQSVKRKKIEDNNKTFIDPLNTPEDHEDDIDKFI